MFRRTLTPAVLACLPVLAVAGPATFDFRAGGNAAGHPVYDAERGFGFEVRTPDVFSVRVPEGNHRVTVRLRGDGARASRDIYAEQRRHVGVLPAAHRGANELAFVVNIRNPSLGALPDNAAGGTAVRLKPRELGGLNWDDRLSIEVAPTRDALESISIEAVDVPTLYLAGDSTVTDQPEPPNASWGQRLPALLAADIAVANHAESGESLKSFVTAQRLDKLLGTLRAGDWVMIQFGHNDQKTQWPQTYADAASTYRAWLRTYVAEIRRRGATPLLVTSPERRNFDASGHIVPTLADYAAAMRDVARDEHLTLIDLNAMSTRFYEALGPRLAPRAFADGGNDRTHFNEYGAEQLARCVVAGLRAADPALTAGLAAHVDTTLPDFDPAHPEMPP